VLGDTTNPASPPSSGGGNPSDESFAPIYKVKASQHNRLNHSWAMEAIWLPW